MAGSSGRYAYQSDDGELYSIRMDDSNALAIGNVPDAVSPGLPGGYRPRYVLATHAGTGNQRKIVVGDPTNATWLGPGAGSVSLVHFTESGGAAEAHAVRSRVGEKRYNY